MNDQTAKMMNEKLTEYIKENAAVAYVYELVAPILAEWEGKKITKRLQTKMEKAMPGDFHVYISNNYSFIKLCVSKGRRNIQFYLCNTSSDKIFYMDYFNKNNPGLDDIVNRINKYTEGITHTEEWANEYARIRTEAQALKEKMEKYGCQYLIDWQDMRYTL